MEQMDAHPPGSLITPSNDLKGLLKKAFGFDNFLPYQEKVCQSVVNKNNVLLIMPTGAGKSLCYQLPGITLGGTTLVVSPLIALMEDQVMKLQSMGFAADRIHSGRTRPLSRKACIDYLQGKLDFFFIAPERLSVPGFPEMLGKRKPVLIAVDEAHCISLWGHDFRPDYRLLGEKLPILKPAHIIAMTATATPRVQEDIVRQLDLKTVQYHIHGFRRNNIAIEVVELSPGERSEAAISLLKNKNSRPAIVYAPTRKKAELFAQELKQEFRSQVYHAGLTPQKRDEVQAAFLAEDIEVIVATIAFGMGIDKPNIRTVIHLAMPGSLENYYQEIGRVGRDGNFSRAILFHSYGDRHMHLFFYEKNYPEENVLKSIFNKLTKEKTSKGKILPLLNLDEESFDIALEKLWIYGGVLIDTDENFTRGHDKWGPTYKNQKSHRIGQIDGMSRYTDSYACRMLYLLKHFGDIEDSHRLCGICDYCAPENTVASKTHLPNDNEKMTISTIMNVLEKSQSMASGRLYTESCKSGDISRREFEKILSSLVRIELVNIADASFEKEARTIHYKRVEITKTGLDFEDSQIGTIKINGLSPEATSTLLKAKKVRKARSIKAKNKGGSVKKVDRATLPDSRVRQCLQEWRLKEAKRRRIPAFRIFSNKTLDQLASDLPDDHENLLSIKGIGQSLANKYGDKIIEIIRNNTEFKVQG